MSNLYYGPPPPSYKCAVCGIRHDGIPTEAHPVEVSQWVWLIPVIAIAGIVLICTL